MDIWIDGYLSALVRITTSWAIIMIVDDDDDNVVAFHFWYLKGPNTNGRMTK